MRVLIVDGSAAVRTRLGERFVDEGFAVLHADSAARALELLRANTVTTIVLDLHAARSEEPAIEWLVRLRSAEPDAMIVVLTNDTEEVVRRECLRRGADFFFDKSREYYRVKSVLEDLAANRDGQPH